MNDERVRLVREISRSGVATVWEGWDSSLDRKVLVKSIHPQFARDSDLRIRFEREARAIARISHPNVVQIYDIQAGEDSLSLMLEFVDGITLGSLLKNRGILPIGLALRIITEILAGLEQAHAHGIVHRDLKPDNILIAQNGVVKITDFGLASLRDLPAVTQEGMVVGTPSYMSPEQALGGETGPQTDLFTCGAMLFEMLTGLRLIQGENLGEAFQNVMKYRPPDLNLYADVIPINVRMILEELIERDPSERPHSASVVRNALLADPVIRTFDLGQVAEYLGSEGRVEPVGVRTPSGVLSRKRSLIWYGTAAVLLIATVVALITTKRDARTFVTEEERPVPVDTLPHQPADTALDSSIVDEVERPIADTVPVPKTPEKRDSLPAALGQVEPEKPTGPAFATITSTPWSRVFYNDSLLGTTPMLTPIQLPQGKGTLLFLNDQVKLPVSRTIELVPGDTTEIAVNLQESIARLRIASVRPWADVYVDGELKFRTPSTQIVFLPLGKHVLELRHPEFPTYTKELIFESGDPVYEVRVDLTQM